MKLPQGYTIEEIGTDFHLMKDGKTVLQHYDPDVFEAMCCDYLSKH